MGHIAYPDAAGRAAAGQRGPFFNLMINQL
jgi:hypothetical protein